MPVNPNFGKYLQYILYYFLIDNSILYTFFYVAD